MNDNTLDLRRHSREIKRNKWLIILSIIAFALLAIYYCMHHMPEYDVSSVMLIEEEQDNGAGATLAKAGGISQMMRAFSIGGFGASSVDNERIIAETHEVLVKTIKDLELNRTYVGHDGIERKVLYRDNSPIKVEAPAQLFDTLKVSLKMNIKLDGNNIDIKVKKGLFKTIATLENAALPCDVRTPYGTFTIVKTTPQSHVNDIPTEITVSIAGNDALAEYYRKKIDVDLYDKKADAIEFTYKDACPKRGIDILNTLMSNYNKARKSHKDEVSHKEIEFYDNRIASLAQEMNDADNRMVEFKRQNNIVDIESQAGAMIKANSASQQEAVKLQAEMQINQMLLDAINKSGNSVLPAVGDETTAAFIEQYNELIATKQDLERSAKPSNEALISLNDKIKDSKKAIAQSAQKAIEASGIKLKELKEYTMKDESVMSRVPSQEKEYFNLLRDKELKNQLFIFLMQRRESSMLQLTKNTSPSFIIDKAYSSVKPSLLKPVLISLILLILGLLLPIGLILFMMKKRNRIIDPFDLDVNWEKQSWKASLSKKKEMNFNELRSKLFVMENIKKIYTYDVTGTNHDILSGFISCVENASKNVNKLKVSSIDKLYSQKFNDELEQSKQNDYIFIEIEQLDKLSEINDKLKETDSGLLLLIKQGMNDRDDFKRMMQDICDECIDKTLIIIA